MTTMTTKLSKSMNRWIVPLVAALTGVAISLLVYSRLPLEIAIHFSAVTDQPDNYLPRLLGAFALPLLIIALTALTGVAIKTERDPERRRRSKAFNDAINAILAVFLLMVHAFIIAYNLGLDVNLMLFSSIVVGVLFLLLGNLLPRAATIRTNIWPRLSDAARRKIAAYHGRFIMVIGAAFLALVFLPGDWTRYGFIGLLALLVIGLAGSSVYYTRKFGASR